MTTLRILFVEDNDYLRETISELMEAPGREIVACGTAAQALSALDEAPADVLITDVSLGEMSGTELAKAVLATRPAQWVVFCSGYPFPPDLRAFGPNVRSLAKPFEIEELDTLLAEVEAAVKRAG